MNILEIIHLKLNLYLQHLEQKDYMLLQICIQLRIES